MTTAHRVNQQPLNLRIAQDIINQHGITPEQLWRPVQHRSWAGIGFNPEPDIWRAVTKHVTGLHWGNKGILVGMASARLDLVGVHQDTWPGTYASAADQLNDLAVTVVMATIMRLVPQPEMHQMHLDADGRLSGSPFSWPEFIEAKKAGAGIS